VWFLDVPEVPDGTFDNEFALVFGGTVSAGAYTAGAIDFLIEALDCFRSTDGWKGSQTQYDPKGGNPESVPGAGIPLPVPGGVAVVGKASSTGKGAALAAATLSGSNGFPSNGSDLIAEPCASRELPCGMFPILATLWMHPLSCDGT